MDKQLRAAIKLLKSNSDERWNYVSDPLARHKQLQEWLECEKIGPIIEKLLEQKMSELTQCNFCGLEAIKTEAKGAGMAVTILPSYHELKGFDVYVHPRDINIHLLRKRTKEKYWRCWYWAIGAKCEC